MATRKLSAVEIVNLKRRIAAIPDHLRTAARAAAKAEAEKMAENMRRAVPVVSGALRQSIKVEDVSDEQWVAKVKIVAGGPATTKKIRAGVKDHDAAAGRGTYDYATAVEFGHRSENGTHVPAEPFFFSAYRNRKKAARAAIGRAITKAAKAEAAKN